MTITAFGVFLFLAFALAYIWARKRFLDKGWPERRLADLALLAVIFGMIGARARYVWERPEEFSHLSGWAAFSAMIDINNGGMVWYGGFITATVAMAIYAWRVRLPIPAAADVVAPTVLLGLAVGRIGCFFNGCCFGKRCDLPWAVAGLHPTQLYEVAACVVLALLTAIAANRLPVPGHAACCALAGYGLWRFVNESLRDPGPLVVKDLVGFSLTTSQITSLWLILVAGVLAAWYSRLARRASGSGSRSGPAPEPGR